MQPVIRGLLNLLGGFLYSAQMMSQITPLEVDILFEICDKLHGFNKIMYEDFQAIAPEQYMKQVTKRLTE